MIADQETARSIFERNFGNRITFYHPGMVRVQGKRSCYRAVSITGNACELMCRHCMGKLLEPMIPASNPESLRDVCRTAAKRGDRGILISGGSNRNGRLPWDRFLPVIAAIKSETDLHISIHTGFLDMDLATRIKSAGVDQALLDIVADQSVYESVFNISNGVEKLNRTLAALESVEMEYTPHIILGIEPGRICSEYVALELRRQSDCAPCGRDH